MNPIMVEIGVSMSVIEESASALRRAVSDAELRGEITEAEALAYVEVLYKLERTLKGADASPKR